MMMPGHTHEDIDAMFRFIADALRAKGLVRTIDEFVAATECAFKQQKVHVEQVVAVYNYSSWLKGHGGHYEQIKTARYFLIARRESDGAAVMWYKPYAAHRHLYPTVKDPETRMPCFEIAEDDKEYETCMEGIEVLAEVPATPQPEIQKFEIDRLDVDQTYKTMKEIFDLHPLLFGEDTITWWQEWKEHTPTTEMSAVEAHPLQFLWPTKAVEWQAPTLECLRSEYAETITYLNTKGKQAFRPRDAEQSRNEQSKEAPPLAVGDLLVLKPGADDGMHRLPFWIAEVAVAAPPTEKRVEVFWRSAFKNGRADDDISGQWHLICVGSTVGRGGCMRYHQYGIKCTVRGKDMRGHGKMVGTVERDEVALYFPKLTKQTSRMYALTSNPRAACFCAHHNLCFCIVRPSQRELNTDGVVEATLLAQRSWRHSNKLGEK